MNILQAVITGIVQGLTEFLPVSSSGHLVLTSAIYQKMTGQVLQTGTSEEIFFDLMLHFGTIIAVIIFFREDLKELLSKFFKALKTKEFCEKAMMTPYITVGTIATILTFFPLKTFIEGLIASPSAVGIVLIGTGVLLFTTEIICTYFRFEPKKINARRSFLIGIAQGFAIMPGLSRSGSTIIAGLLTGIDRVQATRFSFLLSIPIIILGTIAKSFEIYSLDGILEFNFPAILIGTIISGIVGYFCIKYFIKFIADNKLYSFAIYCIAVGSLMFWYFKV